MPDLLLIRHGQTDGNVSGYIMGRSKHPLNNEGRAQSRRMAKFLKDIAIDAIYTSPSMRAMQTAQIIMKGRDTIPFVENASLDEIEFGSWVGKSIEEIRSDGQFAKYLYTPDEYSPPGGEKIDQVQKRAVRAVEDVLKNHSGGQIVLVSHADVIKSILAHYLDIPLKSWQKLKIDNASLSILRFREGAQPRAIVINAHCDAERYCDAK